MKMTRWMMLAALAMLSSAWARADSAHYVINLEGWDDPQEFTFIPNPELPPPADISPCLPVGNICGDASVRINSGGGSQDESGTFNFNSDQADQNGNIFFENTGPLIEAAEITTVLTSDESAPTFPFLCDGGDIFQQCGFVLQNSGGIETLDAYFYDPYNEGILSATPEPSQWIILVLVFAGIVVARARKRSANFACAQTQRSACPTLDL